MAIQMALFRKNAIKTRAVARVYDVYIYMSANIYAHATLYILMMV